MKKTTNVVILVRVSTDQQDYQRQIKDLTEYANRNNYHVHKVLSNKISATNKRLSDRNEIAELRQLVGNKEVDMVLVTELTRLGRKAREIKEVYEYLTDNDIPIYIQSIGLDTGGAGAFQKAINNIIVTILAELAELEVVRLSDRIKSGQREARRKGKSIGRPVGKKEDFTEKIKSDPQYQSALRSLRQGISERKVAAISGLSRGTVRKIKNFM